MTLTGGGDRQVPLDTTLSAACIQWTPQAASSNQLAREVRHTLGMEQYDWLILRSHLPTPESDWTEQQHISEVTELSQLIFTSIRSWHQLQGNI